MTKKGDLTEMCKEIQRVIQRHAGLKDRPAMVIAFTCEPDYQTAHWISNVERAAAVEILVQTAQRLITNSN